MLTEFPVGLFHAWTWIELDFACLVYPKPAPAGARPPAAVGGDGTRSGLRSGPEEFTGLRSYQRGDAMRLDPLEDPCPSSARPRSSQFAETLEKELWLDWNAPLLGWDVERRLSQLARWVLDAEAGGGAYGLRLPGTVLEPARGDNHRHDCLKALALFELPAP